MRDKEFVEDLKQKYIKLVNENTKLRKRIEELEKEKDGETIGNIIEKKVHETLNDLLRDYKCPKDDKYKPYLDDDWSYDPERDGLDWSYRPKRGTTGPYPWPYAPEVGDWPPGPQVGDIPPGTIPPGYPYWSIFPPCWPYYPSYRNIVKTGNTTNADDLCLDPYTVSKTGEKIER